MLSSCFSLLVFPSCYVHFCFCFCRLLRLLYLDVTQCSFSGQQEQNFFWYVSLHLFLCLSISITKTCLRSSQFGTTCLNSHFFLINGRVTVCKQMFVTCSSHIKHKSISKHFTNSGDGLRLLLAIDSSTIFIRGRSRSVSFCRGVVRYYELSLTNKGPSVVPNKITSSPVHSRNHLLLGNQIIFLRKEFSNEFIWN